MADPTNNSCNFGTGTSGQVLTSNGAGVAPTFQAAGLGTGVKSIPAWIGVNTSVLYWNTAPYVTSAPITPSSTQTYLVPFSTQGSFTLRAIGVLCAVYNSSDTIRLGIYTMSTSTGAATLLTDFTTVSVTSTGRFGFSGFDSGGFGGVLLPRGQFRHGE